MNYLLIVTHFLSDWILQPRPMARRKASSLVWMGKHLMIIFLFTNAYFWFYGIPLKHAFIYTIAHGIQDRYIWRTYEASRGPYSEEYLASNKYAEDYWWYFTIAVDQIAHLLLLFWLSGS